MCVWVKEDVSGHGIKKRKRCKKDGDRKRKREMVLNRKKKRKG
jgi:hypothetical protein